MKDTVQALMPQGKVVGVREGDVSRFSAIPFAQAPVGALRFRPPEAADWQGTLDATRPGPIAPQLTSRLQGAMGDIHAPQSEDCLHLTVWTPAVDQRRRPVLVWLHGGAWQSGGGALDWYDGARLAALGDMVVVAPNYRLGALGWLAAPGGTANIGLLDQEAAIDWVATHAHCFGGDPDRITVMGQSAGGMMIACILMREPRFQRAILQSASLGRGFRSAAQAREIAQIFLHAAGAHDLESARQLPVQALLDAQNDPAVARWLAAEGAQRSLFAPVADGEILPQDPVAHYARAAARADVIVGSTRDEMAAFPGMGLDARSQQLGEIVYGQPAREWAAHATAHGRKAWAYRFDYRPNETFGACHCIELPFVFGTLPAYAGAPMMRGAAPDVLDRLTARIQQSWISFIRDGDAGWAPWPAQTSFA